MTDFYSWKQHPDMMEDIGMYGYDDHWHTSSSVLAQLSKMMLKIYCVWGEITILRVQTKELPIFQTLNDYHTDTQRLP